MPQPRNAHKSSPSGLLSFVTFRYRTQIAIADVAQTHATRVQDQLREAILEGRLEPGSRLRAEALAERLRSSRTPVREALLLLAREGLVEIEPRRGATVRSFDATDVRDLYEVRALIEPRAAALAAVRIEAAELAELAATHGLSMCHDRADEAAVARQLRLNDDFHGLILRAARSPRLTAAMSSVSGVPRAFRASFWRDAEQRAQSLACHRELLWAIRRGRAELAETAMRMHIQGAGAFLAEVMSGER
ncbi:MAG: GntR family transcriptional regulator [Solirubrobacterales bacterium]|nr:GntR family transcriptional regulator [Solirubrobacterales bacterium]